MLEPSVWAFVVPGGREPERLIVSCMLLDTLSIDVLFVIESYTFGSRFVSSMLGKQKRSYDREDVPASKRARANGHDL